MENTDFVIEHIDEEVQVIADQPSEVTNYPANTDFFIENIDSNVISIVHSLNIEASEVDFRPANTDFFIENIDKNVIAIAETMNLSPSEVDFRPANTAFFVENIDKNLIKIAESLSLTPYEVNERPANTDMFIENIDKNVTLIKGSTNVVTVSGEYININIPDGGKVQSAEIDGNATQQTYSGKNKVDGANPTDANFATASLSNNVITISSTTTDTIPYARWVIDNLSANDVVRYSSVIMDSNGQIVLQYDNNETWVTIASSVKQYTGGTTPATYAWTNTVNTTKVRFLLYANSTRPTGNSSSRYKDTILAVNNSDLSYEPYVGGIPAPNPAYPQPISVVTGENVVKVVGKNLFDIAQVNNLALGTTVVSGASYRGYSLSANAGDTFTLSRKNTTDNNRFRVAFTIDEPASGVAFYDKDGNPSTGQYIYIADTATSVTFTVPVGMSYAFIYLSNSGQTITESMQIQIEKGSTATPYQAYTEQDCTINLDSLELAKVGTYQDRIYKDGGKWYVEKQVGKVVLDGTNAFRWGVYGTGTPSYFYYYQPIPALVVANSQMSNYAQQANIGITGTDQGFVIVNNGLLRLRYGEEMPIADWKAKIIANPMIVYYALATPTTAEITDQTLIDQLEALASATLNQGVNNIWIEIATGNAMPTLKLIIEKY